MRHGHGDCFSLQRGRAEVSTQSLGFRVPMSCSPQASFIQLQQGVSVYDWLSDSTYESYSCYAWWRSTRTHFRTYGLQHLSSHTNILMMSTISYSHKMPFEALWSCRRVSVFLHSTFPGGMYCWLYCSTVMLHTAHMTFWHVHWLYTRSILNYTVSLYFREFYRWCWWTPAWIHLHTWGGLNLTKARQRGRNIIGHRAIINLPGQRGGNITLCAAFTQNGVLLRHAKIGPTTHLTYSHF